MSGVNVTDRAARLSLSPILRARLDDRFGDAALAERYGSLRTSYQLTDPDEAEVALLPRALEHTEPAEIHALLKQAEALGLIISTREVKNIILKKGKEPFVVETVEGDSIRTLSIVISTGAKWKTLDVTGEDRLRGRGVSYCATCDGPLFKGRHVVVVGGGDTALGDAIFLTRFAEKVTVIHRRDKLRATRILQERAMANRKIEFCLNSTVTEIVGTNKVEGVKIKNVSTSAEKTIPSDGVFILIGLSPNSDSFKNMLKLNEEGYIKSDEAMQTSVEGIFVCGDVRQKPLRQIIAAAGEGATAAVSAQHYVERIKGIEYK